VNRTSLSCLATRRTRSSALVALTPAPCPGRVLLSAFSLPRPLSSTASATGKPALSGSFGGTTGLSDFPRPCISGLRPWPSPSGPPCHHNGGQPWDLPGLAHGDSVRAQVLRPRGVRQQLAITLPAIWPSAYKHDVGTPNRLISRLNSPAHTYPCPTLRRHPRGRQRMARGHRGSLLLRRTALSSASPCRFLPALRLSRRFPGHSLSVMPTQILRHSQRLPAAPTAPAGRRPVTPVTHVRRPL